MRSFAFKVAVAVTLCTSVVAQAAPALSGWTGGVLANSGGTAMLSGWIFTVGSAINVSALGVYDSINSDPPSDLTGDGLRVAHDVGLYRISDNALLASATVGAGTVGALEAGFRYASLTEDVLLVPDEYVIVMTMPSFGNDNLILSATAIATETQIAYIGSAAAVAGSLQFPAVLSRNLSAGGLFGPNFQFSAASVPEPATYFLALTAIGMGVAFRRRSHA